MNTDRNFIGIELEKEYFEVAKNRIHSATKSKQTKIIPKERVF